MVCRSHRQWGGGTREKHVKSCLAFSEGWSQGGMGLDASYKVVTAPGSSPTPLDQLAAVPFHSRERPEACERGPWAERPWTQLRTGNSCRNRGAQCIPTACFPTGLSENWRQGCALQAGEQGCLPQGIQPSERKERAKETDMGVCALTTWKRETETDGQKDTTQGKRKLYMEKEKKSLISTESWEQILKPYKKDTDS